MRFAIKKERTEKSVLILWIFAGISLPLYQGKGVGVRGKGSVAISQRRFS